ncbi:hypothetical protein H4684_002050 [Desulfomicrobium macestii]|uniref:Uncharacterized protein n=1 Tax=Desulfomicrobium macestii TaxID=90731 RepID=A0ABR9H3W7_9BACT|nr:hypothetical protein [Desulfomicrobium macestii]
MYEETAKVVILLKNGVHDFLFISKEWIPACAGMTPRLYRYFSYIAFIHEDTTKLFISLKMSLQKVVIPLKKGIHAFLTI